MQTYPTAPTSLEALSHEFALEKAGRQKPEFQTRSYQKSLPSHHPRSFALPLASAILANSG